jgi:poly(A) polymerase/tRNA nucleotidyltransferase (CCA-adding enzyme)
VLAYGTGTLVESGQCFQVSTFRGRKPGLKHDLARRDFTINAMAYDVDKDEIVDPYGGQLDIKRRLVRAVEEPKARFREDPVRLLRAVRFVTELGFRVESDTLDTVASMAPMLQSVAPERIREEFMKLLISPKPSIGLNLMVRTGLLKEVIPELLEGYRKRQNAHHQYTIFKHSLLTVDIVNPALVLRLTALLHDIAKPRMRKKIEGTWRFLGHEETSSALAEEIMARLRFSGNMIEKVTNLIRHHMLTYNPGWTDGSVRRLIRRVGMEHIMDLLPFRRADILAHGNKAQGSARGRSHSAKASGLGLLDELEARILAQIKGPVPIQLRDLAIDGHKVMEVLGLSPGPKVGKVLKDLMEKITDYPELNNERQLTAVLERMKRA